MSSCPIGTPSPDQHPLAALQIAAYDKSPFDYVLEQFDQPLIETILAERDDRVDGHRAVVLETRATGAGFYEEGTRAYWYIVDKDGLGFVVSTVAHGERAERYEEFKNVVDDVVGSLSFGRPRDHSGLGRAAGFTVLLSPLLAVWLRRRRRSANTD